LSAIAVTGAEREAVTADRLWSSLDALAGRAERLSDLRAHRLETVALAGADGPWAVEIRAARREQALRSLGAPLVLQRVREAAGGPLILVKGPELARRYPRPRVRPFGDVDLIVEDADRTQSELLRAGFHEIGDPEKFRDIHHLRPLHFPGTLLAVEIHSRPKWPPHARPVTFAELADHAVPAAVGVDGLSTLPPAEHAVVLAAHGWAHEPLGRVLDLVDIALLLEDSDREDAAKAADRLGVPRLWQTTVAAIDSLFYGASPSGPLKTWARGLSVLRERSVWETHLAELQAPVVVLGPARGLLPSASAAVRQLGRQGGESWRSKVARSARAVRNARRRRSDHVDALPGSGA